MLSARGSIRATSFGSPSPMSSLVRRSRVISSAPVTSRSARNCSSRIDQEIRLPASSAGTASATAVSRPDAWSEV